MWSLQKAGELSQSRHDWPAARSCFEQLTALSHQPLVNDKSLRIDSMSRLAHVYSCMALPADALAMALSAAELCKSGVGARSASNVDCISYALAKGATEQY